jgi:quinolinate synthase
METDIEQLVNAANEELTEDKLPDSSVEEMAIFAREFRRQRQEKRLQLNNIISGGVACMAESSPVLNKEQQMLYQ